jgi:hypothetical protein
MDVAKVNWEMLHMLHKSKSGDVAHVAYKVIVSEACCKRMFRVFQMFQRNVASVSVGCCKSKSGRYTCCNGCTRMLQRFVTNVSSVFSGHMLQVCLSRCLHMFHTYVACVLFRCCIWLQ